MVVKNDAGDVEGFAGPAVIEVWALFGRTVLDVQHLGQSGTGRVTALDCYTIGEGHDNTLVVPPAGLPDQSTFPLVRGSTLHFTRAMRGEVIAGGETLTLSELASTGLAVVTGSTYAYRLPRGARCKVEHNAVTFHINAVPPGPAIATTSVESRRFWSFTAGSLILFASLIVPAQFATPDDETFGLDDRLADARRVDYQLPVADETLPEAGNSHDETADSSRRQMERDAWPGVGALAGAGGPVGRDLLEGPGGLTDGEGSGGIGRAGGPGGMGSRPGVGSAAGTGGTAGEGAGEGGPDGLGGRGADAGVGGEAPPFYRSVTCHSGDLLQVAADVDTDHAIIMGPPDCDAIPQMARNFDPDMMRRNAGILGMIQQGSGHFLASPYGGAFAVGNDDEDIWSGLTGTEVGEAFGVGGLGLVGTGRGDAGDRERTTGLGNIGMSGVGDAYGGWSEAGHRRGSRVPRVRQGKATVKGGIDKDIIRRIVRAHINEVRHCYTKGLARDSKLGGRVTIQFTIGPRGRVRVAVVLESSLDDKRVSNCVAKAVKRWKFPKPRGGGNVVVKYPFVLEPG